MPRGRGRTIDFKDWLIFAGSGQDQSALGVFSGGSLAFVAPGTVLRIRGFVQAFMDATQQVGDAITLTWAIGLFSTDAIAAGAFQDPLSDAYPWLWWSQMALHSELAAGVNQWGISAQRLEVDTKAMRKFKSGQSLVVLCETSSVTGAPVTHLDFGSLRVLIGT